VLQIAFINPTVVETEQSACYKFIAWLLIKPRYSGCGKPPPRYFLQYIINSAQKTSPEKEFFENS
jgi:hypothetical protein